MIKHFYFDPNPSVDVEIKGIPLTIYPTERTGTGYTWACDVYEGFEDDYNNNNASMMIVADGSDYKLIIYRSGVNIDDLSASLDAARTLQNELTTQEFYATAGQTVFTVSLFLLKPKSRAYADGVMIDQSLVTISVKDNTVTLSAQAENTRITIKK